MAALEPELTGPDNRLAFDTWDVAGQCATRPRVAEFPH